MQLRFYLSLLTSSLCHNFSETWRLSRLMCAYHCHARRIANTSDFLSWLVRWLSHPHFHLWTFTTFRCQCKHSRDYNLVGAREFRRCREVANPSRILTFDGSIERMSWVTQHEDFIALTKSLINWDSAAICTLLQAFCGFLKLLLCFNYKS